MGDTFLRNIQRIDLAQSSGFDTEETGKGGVHFALFRGENRGSWSPICGYAGCGISFYITGIDASCGNQKHNFSLESGKSTSPQPITRVWLISAAAAMAGSSEVPFKLVEMEWQGLYSAKHERQSQSLRWLPLGSTSAAGVVSSYSGIRCDTLLSTFRAIYLPVSGSSETVS